MQKKGERERTLIEREERVTLRLGENCFVGPSARHAVRLNWISQESLYLVYLAYANGNPRHNLCRRWGWGDESIYASCQDIWKHCNSSVRELFPAPTSLLAPKRGFRESQLAAHKDEDRGWVQVKLVPRVIRAGVNPGLKRSQFPLDTYSNFITALTALTTSCSCSCICARVLCVTRYCIWQIHGAASPRERPSGRVNDAAHALTVETTTANTDKKTNSTTHTHTH